MTVFQCQMTMEAMTLICKCWISAGLRDFSYIPGKEQIWQSVPPNLTGNSIS